MFLDLDSILSFAHSNSIGHVNEQNKKTNTKKARILFSTFEHFEEKKNLAFACHNLLL
jgi:hypothetical protein